MTGFASARGKVGEHRYLIEAKSLNHRYCEVNVRLPGRYAAWEIEIQKEVRRRFQRGRIDLFLKEEGRYGASQRDFKDLVHAHRQLKKLQKTLNLKGPLRLESLLQFMQAYYHDENDIDVAALWRHFRPLVLSLLDRLEKMRAQEGKRLGRWFGTHVPQLERLIQRIERRAKQLSRQRPKRARGRLQAREDLVPERETVGSGDITEELVRLKSHVKELKQSFNEGGAVGRKIDFLMQEVGREINTIAAKAQDSQISKNVVQFKGEVEKIREQAANVE